MQLTFTVRGHPVTWKRTNSFNGRRITPKAQREYQKLVALVALSARPRRWPLDARYSVDLVIYAASKHRADVDNLIKQVGDSCNGVIWEDDSQIDEWHAVRRYDKANPRIEVTVHVLERRAA